MRERRHLELACGLAVLLAACTTPESIVRQRAAIERNCPEAAIAVTELPGLAYRAEGCGRTETFVCPSPPKGGTTSCIKEGAAEATLVPEGDGSAPMH